MKKLFLLMTITAIIASCTEKQNQNPQNENKEEAMLKETITKFVPVNIKYDILNMIKVF